MFTHINESKRKEVYEVQRRQWHLVLPKIKYRLKRNDDNPQTVCCLC